MSGTNRGPGGYRPGYSEKHSPMYDQGKADGNADAKRPEGKQLGPTPPNPAYRAMYDRGYADGFAEGAA
jgi:hypothetical protein